ncbi:MAG: hypothetical protein AB2A00_08415 [Myxococcota bacterium]
MTRVPRLLPLLVLACAPAPSTNPPAPDHPLWSADAQSLENPLPDGRLVDERGHLRLREGWYIPFLPRPASTNEADALFTGYATHLADLDGWGTFASGLVRFSAPLDADSVRSEDFAFVPLDDDAAVVSVNAIWRADPGFVEVEPRSVLRPASRYALVVRQGPTASGRPLGRAPDFDAFARGEGRADVENVATRLGVASEALLLVATFRTQDVTAVLQEAALRAQETVPEAVIIPSNNREQPRGVFLPDTFADYFPGNTSGLGAAGRVVIGTYWSRDFRNADRIMDLDVVAGRTPAREEDVEFVLVEPDPALHPPPWPAVVVQHGFNGNNRFVMRVAREFNEAGMAVIGIDAIDHGSRGNVFNFFNVQDVRVARDNFRQTVLDQLQLARLAYAGGIDVDGVEGPDLDGTISYFGHSMGAILGSTFSSLVHGAGASVVNAAGGGLTRIYRSPGLSGGIALLTRPYLGLDLADPGYEEALPILLFAAQAIFESADPINYAALQQQRRDRGEAPRLLLQLDVGDTLVPNTASENLADAMGLTALDSAKLDVLGVNALWRCDPAQFGVSSEENPHDAYFHVPGLRRQAVNYIASGGTEVVDPADSP